MTAALATALEETSILRDRPSLAAIEDEWWRLWHAAEGATPFQSPAWLIPWWEHFAPGDLCTIAVRREGRLVGLAPIYREDGPYGRRLLPLGISLSDYLDVLLDPSATAWAGDALAEAAPRCGAWDVWSLEHLEPTAAALRMPQPPGCDGHVRAQETCPVLRIAEVPAGKRRKVRMAAHRAERRGGAHIEAADPDRLDAMLDHIFALHTERRRAEGGAGLMSDPRVEPFLRAALARLTRAGIARTYLLSIGGEIAGGYCGFVHRDRAYAYLGGFSARFTAESPGTLLLDHAMQDAARHGATEMHLLRGAEAYKYSWGAVDRWTTCRSLRRATPA